MRRTLHCALNLSLWGIEQRALVEVARALEEHPPRAAHDTRRGSSGNCRRSPRHRSMRRRGTWDRCWSRNSRRALRPPCPTNVVAHEAEVDEIIITDNKRRGRDCNGRPNARNAIRHERPKPDRVGKLVPTFRKKRIEIEARQREQKDLCAEAEQRSCGREPGEGSDREREKERERIN